jgi:hypothetical protein
LKEVVHMGEDLMKMMGEKKGRTGGVVDEGGKVR